MTQSGGLARIKKPYGTKNLQHFLNLLSLLFVCPKSNQKGPRHRLHPDGGGYPD